MKKKLFVMLCVTALLVTCLAFTASATDATVPEDYICPCCGQDFTACNWQPWAGDHLFESGHYYLAAPLSMGGQRQVGRLKIDGVDNYKTVNVTLNLNGFDYTNTSSRAFAIYEASTLNLVNSAETENKVTGSYPSSDIGGVINLTAGSATKLNVYGNVTVTFNPEKEFTAKLGKLVAAADGGTINVLGGKLLDGKYYSSGAVMLGNKATLNVSDGGTIEGGFVILRNAPSAVNVSGTDICVDLNGRTLPNATVAEGSTLYVMDSVTNDYVTTGGYLTQFTGNVQPVPAGSLWSLPETDYTGTTPDVLHAGYRMLSEDKGYSFHRLCVAIDAVTLRTNVEKEGMYFNSVFAADKAVQSTISAFGIALSKENPNTAANWIASIEDGTSACTQFQGSQLVTGVTAANQDSNYNGTLLKNIFQYGNSDDTNIANADTVIYSVPYIKFNDGTYLLGTRYKCSFGDLLRLTDSAYSTLSESQKAGLLLMYERFTTPMNAVEMANVLANYDNDILPARRYVVMQEMQAMNNILWTVDQDTPYSFRASSKGYEADLAEQQAKDNYNELDDDIGLFYADRIYRGLPYTHGTGNNDALMTFATRDENGVYNITNATATLFNGGSNGTGTYAAYNTARLGNDCWDMVHWAWSRVSTTVTATQTMEMTPDFGVQIVGYDLLEAKMRELGTIGENDSMMDYICTPSTASAIKGLRVYKYIADTEPNGDIDGTLLVHYGTRTGTTAADYQTLYQTYAMMKPGDAMVRWRNGNGHAIMVMDVNVVIENGLIDPDKSTIIMLEQGSGHEERQARPESSFSSSISAKHSTHSSVNKKCKYCAGYTDTVIDGKRVWQLDYNPRPVTFTSLMNGDYIGVTCQELNDNTMAPAATVTDKTFVNMGNIYNGKIYSNYRASKITLEIRDAEGNLVNTATCLARQETVRYSYLELNRWATDYSLGVLKGAPIFTKTGTTVKTDTLSAGKYTYQYTITLGTQQNIPFRSGSFTVLEDGTVF